MDDTDTHAERRAIIASVRAYVAERITPVASAFERDRIHPTEILGDLGTMGILAMNIPARYGGLQLDLVTRSAVFRELAYGWAGLAGSIAGHAVVCGMLAQFGTESQRERWLPVLGTGEVIGAVSLSEPHAGSDLKNVQCRADAVADGFQITGRKTYVTNGNHAGVIIVLVRTGVAELSCLIVEDPSAGVAASSISISRPFEKLGSHGQDTVEIAYDHHTVPADAVLGGDDARGMGLRAALTQLDVGRVNIANLAVGLAQAAFDAALRFAADREAFGQRIDSFQGIQFKLAEMATKLHTARVVADDVSARYDAGEDIALEAAMAKFHCSEAAFEVALDAVRIHGGAGYVSDFTVERYLRDSPLYLIGEGTNEILRTVIARRIVTQPVVTSAV